MPVSQLMEAPPASDGALCRGQRAAVADSGRVALARLAGVEARSGVRWRNWARSQECSPKRVFYPRTLDDVQAIVRAAAASGRRVSVAGRGHTMGPLSLTDDFLIDSAHLNRIGPVDVPNRLVTVESGVSVAELDRVLRRHGLAMPTNVVLTSVRYGGIVATGCHGAGWECQTISDLVDSMTIVTHTGEVVRYSEATHGPDVMNAVRCNLGTLGVIHDITFRVEPDFRLAAVDEHLPLSLTDDLAQLRSFLSGNDYVEVFWLEMRVIRDSNVWLSPAFSTNGEHHCYFELISVAGTPKCHEFFDDVAAAWMRAPELEARPRWAKYFADIPAIVPYIHQAWRGNLAKFADLRDQIDPERMFLNPAMQRILYPAADAH